MEKEEGAGLRRGWWWEGKGFNSDRKVIRGGKGKMCCRGGKEKNVLGKIRKGKEGWRAIEDW